MEVLSGTDAYTVFGHAFTPPKPDRPEANGHRIMVSPAEERKHDEFLTVMTMADQEHDQPNVRLDEQPECFVLTLADRVVVLNRSDTTREQPRSVTVATPKTAQLLFVGLAPGSWTIRNDDATVAYAANVTDKRNTAFFLVPPGTYTMEPGPSEDLPHFQPPPDFEPKAAPPLRDRTFVDGRMLDVPPTVDAQKCRLVPAADVFRTLGLDARQTDDALRPTGKPLCSPMEPRRLHCRTVC
jgi:hypothetical protein